MKKEMRRGEKAMTPQETLDVLSTAEYGVLSTVNTDNTPYGVPVNYVYMDNSIYFHSAVEGHKLENLQANAAFCFTVIDSVVLMPDKFNTQYRSVTAFGNATIVQDNDEKMKAISSIAKKLSPDFIDAGKKYIESAFDKIAIVRLDIDYMTGKATRG